MAVDISTEKETDHYISELIKDSVSNYALMHVCINWCIY